MHLVQLLLPLYDNDGRRFPQELHGKVRSELTEAFGGLTAYTRAPAEGLWAEDGEPPARDDIVIYEVMADSLDRAWWSAYRRAMEERFSQESVVIRSQEIERL